MELGLPRLDRIERAPRPKTILEDALTKASGLRSGRLKRFKPLERVHRLADLILDYAPLRRLPAFQELEEDLNRVLEERSWRKA